MARIPQLWMLIVPASLILAAAVEGLWLQRRDGQYDWQAFLASCGDMALRTLSNFLPVALAATALLHLWGHRLYTMPLHEVWPWIVLFFGQDFCYYWMHRADHRVRWLWATHSVHHSPNSLNLSAAFRLGWTARLSVGPLFFAPLVLAGYPALLVGAVLASNLFYQFWLHATWLPRLGVLEGLLNTPSHHRVHHASNPEYLDANFGGVLIVFDRLFGTFVAEQSGIVIRYGLVHPQHSNNPIRIGLHEWLQMLRDVARSRSLSDALYCAFGPPRVAAREPAVASDHIELAQRPLVLDSGVSEIRQVQCNEPAVADELGHTPADHRRLLQAVAGKTIHQQQIVPLRVTTDDTVVIE
jgi:sterol desaturase/sphingolipid hydroxylase (fatty acid hydroxylase superfamily)